MAETRRHQRTERARESTPTIERDGVVTLRDFWHSPTGLIPLALVVAALVGSVVIPARQTLVITALLRETREVFEPARLHEAKLRSGLADELSALQSYALSGDSTLLGRYRLISESDEQRLLALERAATNLGAPYSQHVSVARRRLNDWRQFGNSIVQERGVLSSFAATVRAGQSRYDDAVAAIADLSADLSAEASARDDQVRDLEHFALVSNAALVLVAFAALYAVMLLTLRERKLTASLRRRVDQEAARARQEGALREAAETLAGAFNVDEVTRRIASAALEALEGRGAFVERVLQHGSDASALLTVVATAGIDMPPLQSSSAFAGSYAECVLARGEPVLIPELGNPEVSDMSSTFVGSPVSAIAVPLISSSSSVGTLFVVSARSHRQADDLAGAAIFGQLAVLAYERVKLLEEAVDARRKLERVVESRSRLMRGFSHDVKNPIGAARSYADLLLQGIYGELNADQRTSIGRMRRCMHQAISLIIDLHELARVETGNLKLSPEPVDLGELVFGLAEDYQASASSSGLIFTAAVADDVPVLQSSRPRVRQIIANLLSNAIKYTDAGSVNVSAIRRSVGPCNENGDWIAVACADTGRGIPHEKLDFIFEEFGRIDDNEKTGAGLGLAISRLLAENLGGQLTVTSDVGRGSTFTLWLPLTASTSGGLTTDRSTN